MLVERGKYGGWVVSWIYKTKDAPQGRRISQYYMGYTKKEAIAEFRRKIKQLKQQRYIIE